MSSLIVRLKAEGERLGFDAVGIAPAVSPPGYDHFRAWLDAGHAAGMNYMTRGAEARSHPEHVLAGARSIIVTLTVYDHPDNSPLGATEGRVARYARGDDYHDVLWRRLELLLEWLRGECPGLNGRAVADTAPLLERDFAQLAGLGWIGKNTMLINRKLGSYTVIGCLLVDQELEADSPFSAMHCGTCTRCLEACPTGAIVAPFQLDARKCLSFWTIEHRGEVPAEIAESLSGWAFGCDICQDVCPWNRKAAPSREPRLAGDSQRSQPDLLSWLEADPTAFRRSWKGTALTRARACGLIRNAILVLGLKRAKQAEPAIRGWLGSEDPGIRAAAAWALGRMEIA